MQFCQIKPVRLFNPIAIQYSHSNPYAATEKRINGELTKMDQINSTYPVKYSH